MKYLNVDNNDMYTIPRLKLLGTRSLSRTPHTTTTTTTDSSYEDHVLTTLSPPSAETAFSTHDQRSDGGVVSISTTPPPASPLASAPLSPTHKLGGEKTTAHSSSIQTSISSPVPRTEGTCSTNSIPIPGSSTDRDGRMGRSPQWSPIPAVKGENKVADFSPFPVLETLSMVNNLVSVYILYHNL